MLLLSPSPSLPPSLPSPPSLSPPLNFRLLSLPSSSMSSLSLGPLSPCSVVPSLLLSSESLGRAITFDTTSWPPSRTLRTEQVLPSTAPRVRATGHLLNWHLTTPAAAAAEEEGARGAAGGSGQYSSGGFTGRCVLACQHHVRCIALVWRRKGAAAEADVQAGAHGRDTGTETGGGSCWLLLGLSDLDKMVRRCFSLLPLPPSPSLTLSLTHPSSPRPSISSLPPLPLILLAP